MPTVHVQLRAAELQRRLAELTGHTAAQVRPYGRHLLIQMHHDDEAVYTVARLTQLGPNRYGAAFRSHTGRWEPLPVHGDLNHAAELLVSILAPHLQPNM